MIISLANGSTAKLSGVLMLPGIGANLLSTQALITQGIVSKQNRHEFKFFREGDDEKGIITKGSQQGETNYLSRVHDENAVYRESAMQSEENTYKAKKAIRKFPEPTLSSSGVAKGFLSSCVLHKASINFPWAFLSLTIVQIWRD